MSDVPNKTTGWQPIETAPKDGTAVILWDTVEGLCLARYADHAEVWRGCWGKDDFIEDGSIYDDPLEALNPTHWMPLPEPPQ